MKSPLEFQVWLREHIFSATDLENHQLCPYRFYAAAYLNLRPANPLEVELTPSEVGSLVHRVLERFLRVDIDGAKPFRILDEELQKRTAERPHLSKPLLALQKKKIVRMLESFTDDLEKEREQASEWKPRYFEWSFGQIQDGPIEAAPPLVLKDADGKPVSFRGRVDRIDVNASQKTFLVIDYKTGSTKISGNQIRNGEALQLPIYLLAVKSLLLKDYEPAGAVYYQLSDMSKKDGLLHAERLPPMLDVGPRSNSLVPASKWDATLESIENKAGDIVLTIRKTPEDGFLSRPEPCETFCPYQDICRLRSSS